MILTFVEYFVGMNIEMRYFDYPFIEKTRRCEDITACIEDD